MIALWQIPSLECLEAMALDGFTVGRVNELSWPCYHGLLADFPAMLDDQNKKEYNQLMIKTTISIHF